MNLHSKLETLFNFLNLIKNIKIMIFVIWCTYSNIKKKNNSGCSAYYTTLPNDFHEIRLSVTNYENR